jgi:hypothetical protein
MNISFCTVVLSLIQGIALNTGVLPLAKGGASSVTTQFFKNLKFHHAFMAYCISNLFQSFEPYSSKNIVKCPFSQVLDTKAFRKKVFYK